MLGYNNWNHLSVCKLFVLGGSTWGYITVCRQIIQDKLV